MEDVIGSEAILELMANLRKCKDGVHCSKYYEDGVAGVKYCNYCGHIELLECAGISLDSVVSEKLLKLLEIIYFPSL